MTEENKLKLYNMTLNLSLSVRMGIKEMAPISLTANGELKLLFMQRKSYLYKPG